MDDEKRTVQPIGEGDLHKLDMLPFGAILVDADGKILFFNQQEEQASGRMREAVLGRNFFTEIAPCSQVKEFYGQFKECVARTGVIATFHFRYVYPGYSRDVDIVMASFKYMERLLCLIIAGDIANR